MSTRTKKQETVQEHEFIGTISYAAPEVCQNEYYSAKSDLWSFGCVIYEICTFQRPFSGNTINSLTHNITCSKQSQIPSDYSKDLALLIDTCLIKNYNKRPRVDLLLSEECKKHSY